MIALNGMLAARVTACVSSQHLIVYILTSHYPVENSDFITPRCDGWKMRNVNQKERGRPLKITVIIN